jgi:hypothetical protein
VARKHPDDEQLESEVVGTQRRLREALDLRDRRLEHRKQMTGLNGTR